MSLSETDVARGQNFAAKPFNKGVRRLKTCLTVLLIVTVLSVFSYFVMLRYFTI